jgi:RimJ/RimL family protein N-acetyltransferase
MIALGLTETAIFEVAGTHRCSRVEWTTDDDNPAAQAFYETLGLPAHRSKIFYRAEDTGTGLHIAGGQAAGEPAG